jgi:hypothetical protein
VAIGTQDLVAIMIRNPPHKLLKLAEPFATPNLVADSREDLVHCSLHEVFEQILFLLSV